MGAFLESERQRQAAYKQSSPHFSAAARADGVFKRRPRTFCLPTVNAEENLYSGIRLEAISYFKQHGIHWHNGTGDNPSNHLCDSQVCCVNFLFPFMEQPDALAEMLQPLYPTLKTMLPLEREGQYVAFEWIGERNYLNERVRGSNRTRGANSTSVDAAVMFQHADGKRQFVLIEWKYTESYSSLSYALSPRGTDRTAIYAPLYERDDCPLDRAAIPQFSALFYEPFYQLMRQQLLANEMEKAHELGADVVSVLHIAPAHNRDFLRVTSPDLQCLGSSFTEVWRKLVRHADRFQSIGTEDMFGSLGKSAMNLTLQNWWSYIAKRYAWVMRNGGCDESL